MISGGGRDGEEGELRRRRHQPPLRVVRDEDPRGWGDEHRPEGVGEGRRWRRRRRRGRRRRDEGRM